MKNEYSEHIEDMTLNQVGGMNRSGFAPLPGHSPTPWDSDDFPDEMEVDDWFTPQVVQETLDKRIIGQETAKKAA